eukprot:6783839-Alexandrium_andersonii.AAC.1
MIADAKQRHDEAMTSGYLLNGVWHQMSPSVVRSNNNPILLAIRSKTSDHAFGFLGCVRVRVRA